MKKQYRVHLYPIIHLALDVTAETVESAVEKAMEKFGTTEFNWWGDADFADDFDEPALVDTLDDMGEVFETETFPP